jgi:hypothetical protein
MRQLFLGTLLAIPLLGLQPQAHLLQLAMHNCRNLLIPQQAMRASAKS